MEAGASKAAQAASAPVSALMDETLGGDPGEATQAPADPPLLRSTLAGIPRHIPVRLGAYELEGLIGEGAMGLVFRARQEGLRRIVALKLMRDGPRMGPNARRRFLREARAMARLHHPNIVAVHEVGEFAAQPFFTMDWVDGVPLDRFVTRLGLADPVIIADLTAQIAAAVDYAHGQGIIHRDLKPANIMMDAQGRPLLTDFGLAKELDSESLVSVSGDIMGTPAFMAPEQAAGHLGATDARSDVYALGALLYWLLSRRKPFEAKTLVETLAMVVHEEPPPLLRLNPRIPHDLNAICVKAMEKDPARRYATAAALADDLRAFVAGDPVSAARWSRGRRLLRHLNRRRLRYGWAAALVGTALVAGTSTLRWGRRSWLDLTRPQLTAPDAARRRAALSSLAEELAAPSLLATEELAAAGALFHAAWRDPDPTLRQAWLEWLGQYGTLPVFSAGLEDEAAAWIMAAADQDDDPALRRAALTALGVVRRPDFATYLMGRLREPRPPLRLAIIRALGAQRTPRALEPLLHVVLEDPIGRAEAEAALTHLYDEGRLAVWGRQDRQLRGAMQAMTHALSARQRQMEDLLAAEGGQPPADAWTGYRQATTTGDSERRLAALYELISQHQPDAVPLLEELLEAPDERISRLAALGLGRLAPPPVFERLRHQLADPDPARRARAAWVLGYAPATVGLNDLLARLPLEREPVAWQALLAALGELNAPEAAPALRAAARRHPDQRQAILRLLPTAEDPPAP